jgi:hypothetical protein
MAGNWAECLVWQFATERDRQKFCYSTATVGGPLWAARRINRFQMQKRERKESIPVFPPFG